MRYKRFAIYYGPNPSESLYHFGIGWFGVDPETGESFVPKPLPDFTPLQHEDLTRSPRRYALHGTLKPPFALASGNKYDDLFVAVERLAASTQPLILGKLVLKSLGGFIALCPASPPTALSKLAAACVTELDCFRAKPSEQELERRRANGLTSAQEKNLLAWGYPYVLDEFRFHITMTGRVDSDRHGAILGGLKNRLAPVLEETHWIRELCIYGEPEDGSPFRIVDRLPLSATSKSQ